MIELIQFINKFQQLDSETEDAAKRYYVEETYKKDKYIVEAGKICTKVIFIKTGLVRRFFFNNDQDVTIWIYGSNQIATCMPSFFGQKPAYEYLQACEDTVAYSVSFEGEHKLLEYSLFAKFHIKQFFILLEWMRLITG